MDIPTKLKTSKCNFVCRWEARIYETGKQRFLGYFTSELAAAEAYDARAVSLHGPNAKVNFPQNHSETMHKEPACKPQPKQNTANPLQNKTVIRSASSLTNLDPL